MFVVFCCCFGNWLERTRAQRTQGLRGFGTSSERTTFPPLEPPISSRLCFRGYLCEVALASITYVKRPGLGAAGSSSTARHLRVHGEGALGPIPNSLPRCWFRPFQSRLGGEERSPKPYSQGARQDDDAAREGKGALTLQELDLGGVGLPGDGGGGEHIRLPAYSKFEFSGSVEGEAPVTPIPPRTPRIPRASLTLERWPATPFSLSRRVDPGHRQRRLTKKCSQGCCLRGVGSQGVRPGKRLGLGQGPRSQPSCAPASRASSARVTALLTITSTCSFRKSLKANI